MLQFTAQGLLTPASIIKSDINELREYFGIDSPENIRRNLYDQCISYTDGLKKVCGDIKLLQWIDGSFVTKKLNPFDIDLVTFIDFTVVESNETALKQFIYPASMQNYQIDGYIVVIYPEAHRHNFAYKADCAYWFDHFDKTKPLRKRKRMPKGFLEIII